MTKETKNKKIKKAAIPNGRFGVVLESIDSKLDLVVEGHKALDGKIDKNQEKFIEFRQEVNYKFDIAFEKFVDIDGKLGSIESELHIIRNDLKEKVGRDEFTLLEKRVATLERKKSQGF